MKKIKILIISLIVILVLGCATVATLYFATDTFKSDKEMFYKSISKVDLKGFINQDFYKEYSEKMKNTKFEENSEISIDIGTLQKKINIETKKDIPNKLATTEVQIDNNDKIMTFAKDNDVYGVKFNELLNGYITIENNNLQELAEKIETDSMIVSVIPNKIEISENEEILNTEEIKSIIKKYENTILNQISDEEYSKVKGQETTFGDETVKADGYKLTLTSEKLVNIIKTLLEEMKNDKEVFNLLATTTEDLTQLTFEDYQSGFESLISDFDSKFDIGTEAKISIIAYEDIKKAEFIVESEEKTIIIIGIESTENPKIIININANSNIEMIISKTVNTAEQEKWEVELNMVQASTFGDETSITAVVSIERQGLLESNSIKNIIDINLKEENASAGGIKYSATTKFNNGIEVDELSNEIQLKINDLTEEQITTIITNLENKLENEVDNSTDYLYSLIGLPRFILNVTPLEQGGIDALLTISVSIVVNLNSVFISNSITATENNILTQTATQAIYLFNASFSMYEGVQRGSAVKTLISTIDSNNTTILENKIECNKTITDIDSSKNYIVSFEKDSEGYINKAIIEEQ